MPFYRFEWINNAVTVSWWIQEHPDDESASREAGEIEEQEYASFYAEPPEDGDSYLDPGGICVEPATEEDLRFFREQEKRRGPSVPLIPPDDLII